MDVILILMLNPSTVIILFCRSLILGFWMGYLAITKDMLWLCILCSMLNFTFHTHVQKGLSLIISTWKLTLIILLIFGLIFAGTQCVCTIIFIPRNATDGQPIIENLHGYFNILFRFLHVMEYFVLMVSIIYRRCFKGPRERSNLSHNSKLVHVTIFLLFIPLYFLVIIIPPILFSVWPDVQDYPSVVYTVIQFGEFLTNFILRIALMLITIRVISIWTGNLQPEENSSRGTETEELPNALKELVEEYDGKGKLAQNLHTLFREWFVLQWIVYFLEIAEDFYFIYDLIYNNITGRLLYWHISLLLYRIFAFGIPYSCGLLMNHYHEKCHKNVVKDQREKLINNPYENMRIMFAADLIPKNKDYNFIPSLCGIINIPLNASGHTLTIVLTLLVFSLSLVSKLISA